MPNQVLPAEFFNEIVRRESAWSAYVEECTGLAGFTDDWSYPSAKSRILNVPLHALTLEPSSAGTASFYDGTAGIPYRFSNPSGGIVNAVLPLNRLLPVGSVLRFVTLAVDYDETGVDLCELFLERFTPNWVNIAAGSTPIGTFTSTSVAGGTLSAGLQQLQTADLNHTMAFGENAMLRLRIAGGPQFVYAIYLSFDSYGPKDR